MVEFDWQMGGGDCSRAADVGEGGQQLNDDEGEALQHKPEPAPDASVPVLRVMVNQEWVPLQVRLAVRASDRCLRASDRCLRAVPCP